MKKIERLYNEILHMPSCISDLKTKEKYKLVDFLEIKIYGLYCDMKNLEESGNDRDENGKYSIMYGEIFNQLLLAKSVKERIEVILYPQKMTDREEKLNVLYPEDHVCKWIKGPERERLKVWEKILEISKVKKEGEKYRIALLLYWMNEFGYFSEKLLAPKLMELASCWSGRNFLNYTSNIAREKDNPKVKSLKNLPKFNEIVEMIK